MRVEPDMNGFLHIKPSTPMEAKVLRRLRDTDTLCYDGYVHGQRITTCENIVLHLPESRDND